MKESPNFLVPAAPDPGFPVSARKNGVGDPTYLEEKKNGARLPNGAKLLKRLTAQHKQMILSHLSGVSNNDIAELYKRTAVSVSRILNDPLALAEISNLLEDVEKEFQALYPKSVERLREAMDAETLAKTPAHTTRLKAIDIYYRANGKYRDADSGAESAEDVIARILANPLVQININAPSKDTPVVDPFNEAFEGELSDGSSSSD